jgi:hypothetical protein
MENEARGDQIAVNDLGHVASCEARAFHRFQSDKAMRRALRVADPDGVGV